MKKGLSIREKVLLCILAVMIVIVAYYYLFYIPMKEDVAQYQKEYTAVDDQIIMTEAQVNRLGIMREELADIKSGDTDGIKELPSFDNRQNLMVQLSGILANTENYNITFGDVVSDEVTASRVINLTYTCENYEAAKAILEEIYNGKYPCIFKDVFLGNDSKTVTVQIIYYEYQ